MLQNQRKVQEDLYGRQANTFSSMATDIGVVVSDHKIHCKRFLSDNDIQYLLLNGDSSDVLKQIPDNSVDCVMTSPPYWGKRKYANGGIGLEKDYREYIRNILLVFREVKRILKPTGSFWLNIGDSYNNKNLLGIPWRVALYLTDEQDWCLRNHVVWNKVKGGMDNSKDKLSNIHESIFHFVKKPKGYYYDVDAIRSKPRQSKIVNGSIVSATGVSGVRYKRQIEISTALTDEERAAAIEALNGMLEGVTRGDISDFRMLIRVQQRTTHSNDSLVSGRAKELIDKGFYFLKYHPKGCKPGDVWDILPEDTHKRKLHYAPFPVDLCRIPILSTCPENGIVLDPFCGSGTTLYAATILNRRSVGIDISEEYLKLTQERL